MPFSSPQTMSIDVLQEDIDKSTVTLGNLNNNYINSIAQALIRLSKGNLLPGEMNPDANGDLGDKGCVFYAEVSADEFHTTIARIFVCTTLYTTSDVGVAVKIALENTACIKPSGPFTINLTKY